MWYLSTALALLLGACPVVMAQELRVSLGDFRIEGDRARLTAARIGGLIEAELLKLPGIRVVERKEKAQVFQEQAVQQSGATDLATAVELGKNLNVDRIIFGTVEDIAGKVHITLKVVKVENSELVFSESGEALSNDEKGLPKLYYDLAERLLSSLSGRVVSIVRPSGPQRLVVILREGDINSEIKLPKRAEILAMLLVEETVVDSVVVARRTGWGQWNVRLVAPQYQAQAASINFYVKSRGQRQLLGGCHFETMDDGVYSFSTPIHAGRSVGSRFRVLFEVE